MSRGFADSLKRTWIILVALVAILLPSARTFALSDAQLKQYLNGVNYFDVDTATCATAGSSGYSGTITGLYMLGDSITVATAASYTQALQAKGITPTIDAEVSRSWNNAGDGSTNSDGVHGSGKDVVDTDKSKIVAASGIVIALGSNGGLDGNPIDTIISKVRSINSSAPIWWVNVTGSSAWTSANLKSYMGRFNKELSDSAKTDNFQVIDWASAVAAAGNPFRTPGSAPSVADPQGLLADGLHPNEKGQQVLANLVTNAVTGGTNQATTSQTGSACCAGGEDSIAASGPLTYGSASQKAKIPKSTDEITQTPSTDTLDHNGNAAIVWQYFMGKGLSAQQIAGLMGNLDWESSFQADNAQNGSSWPTGGYGLAQWTGDRRTSFVNALKAAGLGDLYKPEYADGGLPNKYAGVLLGFELDYIWYELGSILDELKGTSNYTDATRLILLKFENPFYSGRPATPENVQKEMNNRVPKAEWALKHFGASSVGAPGEPISGTCPSNNTGIGVGKGKFTTNTSINYSDISKVLQRAKSLADLNGNLFKKYCTDAGNPNGPNCAGWCAHIAAVVWGYATGSYGGFAQSANGEWQYMQSVNHAHPGDRNPPIGALLFYDTGGAAGHVAVYVGDNMVFSNDILDSSSGTQGGVYITDAEKIEKIWGATYLGWSDPFYDGKIGFGSY